MNCDIIVTRHEGAKKFCAQKLGARYNELFPDKIILSENEFGEIENFVPILASAKEEDVAGKTVWGNLPLSLACKCKRYYAIEFPTTSAPRGTEREDMSDAQLVEYIVVRADQAVTGSTDYGTTMVGKIV